MRTVLKRLAAALLLAAGAHGAAAFSLLGPLDGTFQTAALGYNPFNTDIGGPMNLREEYRWNVPTLTYAFDESFVNYFGSNGVAEVEKAVKVLNDFPNASSITNDGVNLYVNGQAVTKTAVQENPTAVSLHLVDLKSFALTTLVEHMGLSDSVRWTYCLRVRAIATGGAPTNYLVIQRNFDPITGIYSTNVNGVGYGQPFGGANSSRIIDNTGGTAPLNFADAVEAPANPADEPLYPLSLRHLPVAGGFARPVILQGQLGAGGGLGLGQFFNGLTHDDVGGLRYLLRFNNFHAESLQTPNTTLAAINTSPWGVPIFTNATNALTNVLVVNAVRPGIEKVSFQRVNFDSLIGGALFWTNFYTDVYVTNGFLTNQIVRRTIVTPPSGSDAVDIIFTAADLGTTGSNPDVFPLIVNRSGTTTWVNEEVINGQQGTPNTPTAGPGLIRGPITIAFSKLGPYYIEAAPSFFLAGPSQIYGIWASFTLSPNIVVYPVGTTIEDIESQVTGTRSP